MENYIDTLKDFVHDNRAALERERERLEVMLEQQEALEALLGRITQLENERDDLMRERDEQEALATRMRDERDRMAKEKDLLNLKLKELGMMTSKVVKKTDHDDLIDIRALDKAYSIAFPKCTPLNVRKRKKGTVPRPQAPAPP